MALVPTQMLSQQHLLRTGASEKTRRRDVEHVFTFHSHLPQVRSFAATCTVTFIVLIHDESQREQTLDNFLRAHTLCTGP
jgi:hypothetical protein